MPTSSSSIGMSSISSSSGSKLMAFPFFYVAGFSGILPSDADIGIIGFFPFLSFVVSLVRVGFGLGLLGDLGTSANTSKTSGAATSTSISISSTNSSTSIYIASVGAKMMFYKKSCVFFGNVSNTELAIRSS